jgi:diphosphomevalonate decarboxylase
MNNSATAIAYSNIALIKYWGKRQSDLNLPAVGSISLTLNNLFTKTHVQFKQELEEDVFILNNKPGDLNKLNRVTKFLDLIRDFKNMQLNAHVESTNSFPTGVGLASSASAFAALSLAASKAADLDLSNTRLSELARRGSGSAARSIYGGFVEMRVGRSLDGTDAVAVQIVDENYWDIRLLIAITSFAEKDIGSTQGMNHTAETSPFYGTWLQMADRDLKEIRSAIKEKDFEKFGDVAEYNCLKMHSLCFSSRPALIYWNASTLNIINRVREIRKSGIPVYFTIDAGAQVKVLTLPEYLNDLKIKLREIPGIIKVIESPIGPSAKLIED